VQLVGQVPTDGHVCSAVFWVPLVLAFGLIAEWRL